jgi:high affinity Mn2+ porin
VSWQRLLFCVGLLWVPSTAPCQQEPETPPPTLFPHPDGRFWLSGQTNLIEQWHSSFPAAYSGENSLRPVSEHALSWVVTLYTGVQPTRYTELLLDIESAGGGGISDALGLAGFTNLDVVRNPTLGTKPYLARLTGRVVIPLSASEGDAPRGPLSLFARLPSRGVDIRAGKLSTVDVFDVNAVGSDSHLQFTNWTVDNNGGYDYAADTRGYTYGIILEYQDRSWAARYGLLLMPKVANGADLDWDVRRARGDNLEVELRHQLLEGRTGVVRLLGYRNVANMGSYRDAINAYLDGTDPVPDIDAHRQQGRVKYGFGINAEQILTDAARAFVRLGWNEGRNESFAYTEVNSTVALGGDLRGGWWRRRDDKVGLAFVTNGISEDHRQYLALGGLGFLLGDGALNYGRETILEAYYTAAPWHGVSGAVGASRIWKPGYNRERGPVLVPTIRLHVDF